LSLAEAKLELAEKLGQRQAQLIELLATTPKPEITLVYFRSDSCGHCRGIEKSFYSYVQEHPEINLIKIDANQSAEATHMLEALLKGQPPQVPTVLVNDQFIVKGDIDFLPRLIIAINLAKQIGETREEKTKWLFKL
jgi:thiol-disulfide isomerase/thioredoxin